MKSDGNRRAFGHRRVFLCMGEETTLFLDELLSMCAGRAKLSRGDVLSLVFEASSAIKSAAWRGEKRPRVSPGGPSSSRSCDLSVRRGWVFLALNVVTRVTPFPSPAAEGTREAKRFSSLCSHCSPSAFEARALLVRRRQGAGRRGGLRRSALGSHQEKNGPCCTRGSLSLVELKRKLRPCRFLRAFGGWWWPCPVAKCHLVSPAGITFGGGILLPSPGQAVFTPPAWKSSQPPMPCDVRGLFYLGGGRKASYEGVSFGLEEEEARRSATLVDWRGRRGGGRLGGPEGTLPSQPQLRPSPLC